VRVEQTAVESDDPAKSMMPVLMFKETVDGCIGGGGDESDPT
jgi:hypothetical protein